MCCATPMPLLCLCLCRAEPSRARLCSAVSALLCWLSMDMGMGRWSYRNRWRYLLPGRGLNSTGGSGREVVRHVCIAFDAIEYISVLSTWSLGVGCALAMYHVRVSLYTVHIIHSRLTCDHICSLKQMEYSRCRHCSITYRKI